MQEKKINFQVTLEFISFTLKVKLGSSTCTLKVKGSSLTLLSIRTRDSAWTLGSWYPAPKYEKRSVEIKGISQVHILLYGDKFNGEIDIVQFIFTRLCSLFFQLILFFCCFIQLQKISKLRILQLHIKTKVHGHRQCLTKSFQNIKKI